MSSATVRCPYCAEDIRPEAMKCKHCGTWLATPPKHALSGDFAPGGDFYSPNAAPARFERSSDDRMVFGVCSGLGHYLGVDPTLVRVVAAATTFFTAVVPGVVIYVILAMIVPAAPGGKG